jgi:hypothetical protein
MGSVVVHGPFDQVFEALGRYWHAFWCRLLRRWHAGVPARDTSVLRISAFRPVRQHCSVVGATRKETSLAGPTLLPPSS